MSMPDRVKSIIITPKKEWRKIAAEEQSLPAVIMSYVLPLALVGAAATFTGFGFIGVDTGLLGLRIKGMDWGLYTAIKFFVTNILSVLISAYVVDMLAPLFGSEKNLNKSTRLVAYSYTPGLIGAFLNIVPMLSMTGCLLGFYGIYLWYLGLGPMKKTPEDKKVIYLVISIVVLIVVLVVVGLIMGKVLGSIFGFGALGDYGRFGL